jgi:hypothetical protein
VRRVRPGPHLCALLAHACYRRPQEPHFCGSPVVSVVRRRSQLAADLRCLAWASIPLLYKSGINTDKSAVQCPLSVHGCPPMVYASQRSAFPGGRFGAAGRRECGTHGAHRREGHAHDAEFHAGVAASRQTRYRNSVASREGLTHGCDRRATFCGEARSADKSGNTGESRVGGEMWWCRQGWERLGKLGMWVGGGVFEVAVGSVAVSERQCGTAVTCE